MPSEIRYRDGDEHVLESAGHDARETLQLDAAGRPVWDVVHAEGTWTDIVAPLAGLTIDDGVLVGRWWRPNGVEISVDQEPFLCVLHVAVELGAGSSVDSDLTPIGEIPVGGSLYLVPVDPASDTSYSGIAAGAAYANHGGTIAVGTAVINAGIFDSASQDPWGATDPFGEAWAEGDKLVYTITFQARIIED